MSSVYNITKEETDKSGSRNAEIISICCQSEDSSGLLLRCRIKTEGKERKTPRSPEICSVAPSKEATDYTNEKKILKLSHQQLNNLAAVISEEA